MALTKTPININFSKGLNTKADPFQVPNGEFDALTNCLFTKDGLIQKRNGYALLTEAPTGSQTLATLNDGLVALGNTCQSYNANSGLLTNAGTFQPMDLSAQSMVRRATSQTTCDVGIASNGLACSVWLDSNGSSYYQISDSESGQITVPAVVLPTTAVMPRVFVLGQYFIVTYLATVAATSHLQYVAIPINNPGSPHTAADISTQASSLSAGYDGYVYGSNLYIGLNCSDGGGAVRVWALNAALTLQTPRVIATFVCTTMSVTVDSSNGPNNPIIWVSGNSGTSIQAVALNSDLTVHLTITAIVVSSAAITRITSIADDNILTVIYETPANFSYTPNTVEAADLSRANFISKNTLTLAGVAGAAAVVSRGVGLASKAMYVDSLSTTVLLASYGLLLQPTYFLLDIAGNQLAKLAYSNGVGLLLNQILPSINQSTTDILQVGYLFADQLLAQNKGQGLGALSVYAQYGVNLATFTLSGQTDTLTIAGALHASVMAV